jgi:WD40 repeat protein
MLPIARMQPKTLFFSLVHRMIATLINCVTEKTSAHSDEVYSVAFSPDGTKIVSGSRDRTIKVLDSGARQPSNCPSLDKTDALLACLAGKLELLSEKTNAHSGDINSVAFSPDGTKIVSGSDDKTIKVWELRDQPVGEHTFVASMEDQAVIDKARENGWIPMSINGINVTSWEEIYEELYEVDGEVTIKVWDSGVPEPSNRSSLAKTDALLACLAGKLELLSERTDAHSHVIMSVAFSPDGTKIVTGSWDMTLKVWDSGAP